jgi:hypothetical protein
MDVREVLVQLGSNEALARERAETLLQEQVPAPGFLAAVLASARAPAEALPVRQMALTVVKQAVRRRWEEVAPADQKQLRAALLEAIPEPSSLRPLFHACVAQVASRSGALTAAGFEDWPELLVALHAGLGREEPRLPALEALSLMLEDCGPALAEGLLGLAPELLRVAQDPASTLALRRRCIDVHNACVVSLVEGSHDTRVDQDVVPSLPGWFAVYTDIVSTPTLERESVQAVFAVMKSLNKLCKNRLDRAVLPCLEAVLNPTCVFIQSAWPTYEQMCVLEQEGGIEDEEEGGLQDLVMQTSELLSTFALKPRLKALLKGRVRPLLTLLAPFAQITETQVHTWAESPNEFLIHEDDEHAAISVRLSLESLISELLEAHAKETRGAVLEVAQQLLERGSTARQQSPEWWRWTEVGFLLLGFLAPVLGRKLAAAKAGKPPAELAICHNLIQAVGTAAAESSAPVLLRCRGLIVLARCSVLVEHAFPGDVLNILQCAAAATKGPKLLQVCALKPLGKYLKSAVKAGGAEAILAQTLAPLGELVRSGEDEVLGVALEALTHVCKDCPGILVAQENEFGLLLRSVWTRTADPFVLMQLSDLVSFGARNDLAGPLHRQFLPHLATVIGADAEPAAASNALELYTVLMKHAPLPLSEAVLVCVPSVVQFLGNAQDSGLIQNACEATTALLKRAANQLTPWVEGLLAAVVRLLRADLDDSAVLYLGPVITELVVKVTLPPSIAPALFEAMLTRLQKAEMLSLQESLLVVFSRLLLADVAAVAAALAAFEVDVANVGRVPGLDALLLCAVRRAEKVLAGRVAKNAVYSALVLVVESQDHSIAALRARRPELRQTLLAIIVTALTQEVEKEKDRQSAVERQLRKQSADDDDEEDFDEALLEMSGGLDFGAADEYRDLLDAFCDDEDGEDDDEEEDSSRSGKLRRGSSR